MSKNTSFKDLPKPGVKLGKKSIAWSKSYESKGNMTVKKVLLHPGEVSSILMNVDQLFETMVSKQKPSSYSYRLN
jgi:hypothetical protein